MPDKSRDSITINQGSGPMDFHIEVVERKGIGHPDTLADALAERMSVAYALYTRERFGAVLHHNLDKVYLRGGHAHTGLGTFEMTEPVILFIGGRVSRAFASETIDYCNLFEEVARDYFATVLPKFDSSKWLKMEHLTTSRSRFASWFHPKDLTDLPELHYPTASDTVAVTAWWPNTPTENLVLQVERYLNQEASGPRHAHLGQDIKIMACRKERRVTLTLNVPVFPDSAPTAEVYENVLKDLHTELLCVANATVNDTLEIELRLNTQSTHPFAPKRHYLLGTGTCLELGEEGFVGRGNGATGLISVYRPKSVEAPFGKNPTYHSGKVYTLYAEEIAREIHRMHGVAATVTIVAANGELLRDPVCVAVSLHGEADQVNVKGIVQRMLESVDHLTLAIDNGRLIPR